MLHVAALELAACFGRQDQMFLAVHEALASGPPADLVLLPECALTGYVDARLRGDLSAFAEPVDGPTLARLRRITATYRIYLGAPLIEAAGARLFNSFVVLSPDGEVLAHYRKRHPWYPETWATPGDLEYPVFTIQGLRLTLALCFDIHFIAAEMPGVLAEVDALLFPSAWVDEPAGDLRQPLFAALVRRFGLAIVNANWGVGVPSLWGQGQSRMVLPHTPPLFAPAVAPGQWSRVDAVLATKAPW